MIDIYATPDTTPRLATIEEDIRKGLPNDLDRMRTAKINEDFYEAKNAQYLTPRPSEEDLDFKARPKRTSKLTRKCVRTLSAPLYKAGPTRRLEKTPVADKWLQEVYEHLHVDNKLTSANRNAILNGVAALQVEATGDAKNPVKLWLWRASEFAVFTRDGDPTTPWAVVVRDTIPVSPGTVRARYRAWTAFELATWWSDPFPKVGSSIGQAAKTLVLKESGASPYAGVLPFVFIRNEPPETDFWAGGIGDPLRECNADIDRALSNVAEHVEQFLNPRLFLKNVSTNTRFLDRIGSFLHLKPPPGTREGDNNIQPDAFALQVNLGVEQAWLDMKNYADLTIEEMDIPLTAIRSDASTDLSGVAIIAKQVPMVAYIQERQKQFSETEEELACKVMAVAGTHHLRASAIAGDEAASISAAELMKAAKDPGFCIVWPEPGIPFPTLESDQADKDEMDQGLSDPIEVLARRRNLTLERAEEEAEAIAERRAKWNEIQKKHGIEPVEETPNGQPAATTDNGQPDTKSGPEDDTETETETDGQD